MAKINVDRTYEILETDTVYYPKGGEHPETTQSHRYTDDKGNSLLIIPYGVVMGLNWDKHGMTMNAILPIFWSIPPSR
ncbi:MAG: hypothetical protein K2X53_05305 [Alphaproteobacteria bacterium]|nr:hypothetical protein [Alphaproteobacteria bacterium]